MVVSIVIQKGGTGKTATAATLAQAAADAGQRVLAIDLDPQGDLSLTMGANMTGAGCYEFLTDGDTKAIRTIAPRMDIIPASIDLAGITSETGAARLLQDALAPVKGKYDIVIVDTPPTAGVLQYNALQAADGCIIPLQADIYSAQSLLQVAETIQAIQETNKGLRVLGVVFTQYDGRSTIAKQMREKITETAEGMNIPVLGAIRQGVAIKEAAALQQSLYEYAPYSNPALDYMAIYEQIRG